MKITLKRIMAGAVVTAGVVALAIWNPSVIVWAIAIASLVFWHVDLWNYFQQLDRQRDR